MKIWNVVFNVALIATLASLVTAQNFYFGPSKDESCVIKGVLIGEIVGKKETFYRVRVEGGTIEFSSRLVKKIVKTSLTVADIEKTERLSRIPLMQADAERRKRHAIWREQYFAALKAARQAEASRRSINYTCYSSPTRTYYYNPVLHRYGRSTSILRKTGNRLIRVDTRYR